MKKIGVSPIFFLFFSGLLCQPPDVLAGYESAETVVKVDKGDVVWSSGDADGQQVYFSTYKGGAWSEPVKVTNDAFRNGHPVIDAGKGGERMLVWTTALGGDYTVRFAVGKGDTWTEPASIPYQLKENLAPSVVFDNAGVAWVAWSANDGGQDEIYFSRYAEESWSIPMRINSGNEVPDILPVISLNAKGIPQVTWQGYRHDDYVQLLSTWNGESWSEEIELEVVEEETTTEMDPDETETVRNASIANMPSFIERPEEAYLRVYKSSVVK